MIKETYLNKEFLKLGDIAELMRICLTRPIEVGDALEIRLKSSNDKERTFQFSLIRMISSSQFDNKMIDLNYNILADEIYARVIFNDRSPAEFLLIHRDNL